MNHPFTTAALPVIAFLVCIGCSTAEPEPEIPKVQVEDLVNKLASVDFKTKAEVQHEVSQAAESDRAILFIHVDWAPMEPQRTRFAQFMRDYQQAHPKDDLQFHYVDCTPITSGYYPLRSLAGWAELEAKAGTSLTHGHGELVWLQRGHIFHVQPILDFESTEALIVKTGNLMP